MLLCSPSSIVAVVFAICGGFLLQLCYKKLVVTIGLRTRPCDQIRIFGDDQHVSD
jgi:hypothetical protein